MMQISRSEHELSELSCFRIRTDPELLSQWKHLFCEQPTQSFSKGKVLIPQSCKLTKVYYVLDGFIELSLYGFGWRAAFNRFDVEG